MVSVVLWKKLGVFSNGPHPKKQIVKFFLTWNIEIKKFGIHKGNFTKADEDKDLGS